MRAGEGRSVLITGEAGIGKTRLADEALRRLEASGFLTLRGRCLPETPAPYLPLFEALKSRGLQHMLALERPPRLEYLHLANPHGLEIVSASRANASLDRDIFLSMLSAVESFVSDSLSSLEQAPGRSLNALGYGEWRILIVRRPFGSLVAVLKGTESERLVAALEEALDTLSSRHGAALRAWDGDRSASKAFAEPLEKLFEPGRFDGSEEGVDPKDRKFLVLEGLFQGLARQASRQPVALFLDDLHLADSATISAFQYLARSNRGTPLLLLGAYRSDELSGPKGARHPLAAAKAALSQEAVLDEVLVGPFDESALRLLAEAQLAVKDIDAELVKALFAETRGAPFFAIEVLRYLLAEGRLERLGGRARLKGAIGAGAVPAHLRDAVRHRLLKVPREERDILECAAVDGERFDPARVARALGLRKLVVVRALRNLEEDHHLVSLSKEGAAFEYARVREVVYEGIHPDLRREYHAALAECALEEAEETGADKTETAAFHFARAKDPRAKPLLLKAAGRAAAASSHLEAADWYERYFELAPEDTRELVLAEYANALLLAGRFERAAVTLRTLVKGARDSPSHFTYLLSLAEALGQARGFEEAVAIFDAYTPAPGGLAWARWAVNRSRYVLRVGDLDRAEKDVSAALPVLEARGGSPEDRAEALGVLAFIGQAIGDFDKSVDYGKRAIAAVGPGSPSLAQYCNTVGVGQVSGGHFAQARATLARGLEIAEARSDFLGVATLSANLGFLEVRGGNTAAARRHLERGLKWAERIDSPSLMGTALDLLGLCCLEEGSDAEAAAYFLRAAAPADAGGDKGPMINLRLHTATLELDRGDPDEALRLAGEAYELAASAGKSPEQALARALMAGASGAQGEVEGAVRGFEHAVQGLQSSPARFEFAECLRLYGQFLLDVGRPEDAAARLRHSREVFAKIEAGGRVALLDELLRAAGAPGAPPTTPAR